MELPQTNNNPNYFKVALISSGITILTISLLGALTYFMIEKTDIFRKDRVEKTEEKKSEEPQTTESSDTTTPPKQEKPLPDELVETSVTNVIRYTSHELGITFTYLKKDGSNTNAIKRVGNTIYVYETTMKYDSGQHVEVITKNSSETITQAITTKFLTGYSADKCKLNIYTSTEIPNGYQGYTIDVYPTTEDLEELFTKLSLCPKGYTRSNGITYFEYAPTVRTDKYVYFSIGQYAIAGDKNNHTWQETLRFITN